MSAHVATDPNLALRVAVGDAVAAALTDAGTTPPSVRLDAPVRAEDVPAVYVTSTPGQVRTEASAVSTAGEHVLVATFAATVTLTVVAGSESERSVLAQSIRDRVLHTDT